MTTLEKIRAEIEKAQIADFIAVVTVLDIIDKYASEECDRDCEHCAWIECPIEPCEDAVSREAVVDDFIEWREKLEYAVGEDYSGVHLLNVAIQKIWDMPSVTSKPIECEDAVSRQAVVEIIEFEDKWLLDAKGHNKDTEIAFSGLKTKITNLPCVQPKAKTGRWKRVSFDKYRFNADYVYECQNCKEHAFQKWNYCPNCGARMADE